MIPIPQHARAAARRALEVLETANRGKRYGLTSEEAEELGIRSGQEMARAIAEHDALREEDARAVARFYLRFRNCHTDKCNGAINLWGGRKWGKLLAKRFYP